jgi:hypothetical protein
MQISLLQFFQHFSETFGLCNFGSNFFITASGAAGAERAQRLGKTNSAARRRRCRRRVLFC